MLKNKLILVLVLLTNYSHAIGVRGGGDPLALEFKAIAEVALRNMQSLKGALFQSVNFKQLQDKIDSVQVVITDQTLDVSKGGFVQFSAAANEPESNLIVINRAAYQKISSVIVQQALALHEFLSLLGLESTANYPISAAYLSANTGGTAAEARQRVALAGTAAATKPKCSSPAPDAATLFSMITNPNTSADAVRSFLNSHVVAPDAINESCNTTLTEVIIRHRADLLETLYDHYLPDPNQDQTANRPSIYKAALIFGDVATIKSLQHEAAIHGQNLEKIKGNQGPLSALLVVAGNNPLLEVTKYFLQNAEPDIAGALQVSLCRHNTVEIGTYLLHLATIKDIAGNFALTCAVSRNLVPLVQDMIQKGVDVNETPSTFDSAMRIVGGVTALHENAGSITPEMLTLLLKTGAKVNVAQIENSVRKGSATPLMFAAYSNSAEVVRMILQAGATVRDRDADGDTALTLAVEHNTAEVVKIIIQAGDNPRDYARLLSLAVTKNTVDVLEALLNSGLDVNSETKPGEPTLLEIAVAPRIESIPGEGSISTTKEYYDIPTQVRIIQALLNAGAKDRKTAYLKAKESHAPAEFLRLLK